MPWLALGCLALLAWTDDPPQGSAPGAPVDVLAALESAVERAIARAEPSVVAIEREKSTKKGQETTAIRGSRDAEPALDPNLEANLEVEEVSLDFASGVVIGEKGEILTAYHAVRGARRLRVRAPGHQSFEGEILAADPRSDLAVIVPREGPNLRPPSLRPIALGDASKLRKGAFLIALGNPFNAARDGQASASWGILANVSRRLNRTPEERSPFPPLRTYPTLLQLDTKLNLGMSGGAVVNLKGELVGLTTASANSTAFEPLAGYAIPIDPLSRRAIDRLIRGLEVEYGVLGVRPAKEGSNTIGEATPGSPASEGKLRAGDEILAVGDLPVVDFDSLVLAVNQYPIGQPIPVRIRREDQRLERSIVLGKMKIEGVIATNRPAAWRGLRVDDKSLLTGGPRPFEMHQAIAVGGVLVIEVEPGSPAEDANLKPGQIIKSVDETAVRNPAEFTSAVAGRTGPVRLGTETGSVTVK